MRRQVLLVILAAVSASSVSAQSGNVYEYRPSRKVRKWQELRGQHLRISPAPADTAAAVEGVLLGSRGDTLTLAVDGPVSPVTFVASGTVMVEEWNRSDPTTGATIVGWMLGAVVGGVAANALNDPPAPRRCPSMEEPLSAALCGIGANIVSEVEEGADQVAAVVLGVLVGGAVGGLAGHLIGRASISEGWRRVSRRPRVTVNPTSGGQVQLGIQLTR